MIQAPGGPDRPLIILAFDYGEKRIGVASGDTLTRIARELKTLTAGPTLPWPAIDQLIREYQPARLVVGLPLHMDGKPTAMTDPARTFATVLKSRYSRRVQLVDERLTSREASAQLRAARAAGLKKRRTTHADIDMTAARILLERWFDDPRAGEEI